MTAWPERLLAALGAVMGCLGVGLAAAAAHVTGPGSLQNAAQFLLFHAPVPMALAGLLASGLVHRGAGRAAGFLVVIGVGLFSGDLSVRALAGIGIVPLAAPAGGILLTAGWLLAAVAALMGSRFGQGAR